RTKTNLTIKHRKGAKGVLTKITQEQLAEQGTQAEMELITSEEYKKQLQKAIDLQSQLDLVTKTKEELLGYLKIYCWQLRVLDCLFIGDENSGLPYAQHTADNLSIHFYSGSKVDTSSSGKFINALSACLTKEILC